MKPIPATMTRTDAVSLLLGTANHALAQRAVAAADLKPVATRGRGEFYESRRILRALGRELHGSNARDERDRAIARKANADAAKAEREWIPLVDACTAVSELASIFITAVHELDDQADQDARASFVAGITEAVERTIDSWISDPDS